MPYIPNTPEALIGRSDSKDPSTTCRGLTTDGRPCRRSLAGSSRSRHVLTPADGHGVDGSQLDPTVVFCWQHKSQAIHLENRISETRQERHTVMLQRTSIDTLIDRLGTFHVEEDIAPKPSKKTKSDLHRSNKGRDASAPSASTRPAPTKSARRSSERPPRQRSRWSALSLLCCGPSEYESDHERHRPRKHEMQTTHNRTSSSNGRISTPTAPRAPKPESRKPATSPVPARHAQVSPRTAPSLARPRAPKDPPSQTQQLLSLIPKDLSPQTTSLLLSELAKPFSDADEEGYIYMFCLMDPGLAGADTDSVAEVASTVLDSPRTTATSPGRRRRKGISEERLLNNIAVSDPRAAAAAPTTNHHDGTSSRKSILLKIGRASNVHRRMNEWTRQCGFELSLLRFYPHVSQNPSAPSSSSSTSSPPTPTKAKKVPHVRRVERLIHIELAPKNVKSACRACGQLHREWFAVEPTREGIRAVNEVVARWVRWAENAV